MRVWYQIVVSCMILKGRGHIIVPKQIIFLCKPIAHEECNIPFATLILLENGKRTIEDRLLVWGNGEESEKLPAAGNRTQSALSTELWPLSYDHLSYDHLSYDHELWPPSLTILLIYCRGASVSTPGSHSLCAIRFILWIDRKFWKNPRWVL